MLSSVPCGEASHKSPDSFVRNDSRGGKVIDARHRFNPRREISAAEAMEICRDIIRIAFPGPSIEAIADLAQLRIGADPRAIRRILDGTTKRADWRIGLQALAWAAVSPRLSESKFLPLFNRLSAAVHAAQEGRE